MDFPVGPERFPCSPLPVLLWRRFALVLSKICPRAYETFTPRFSCISSETNRCPSSIRYTPVRRQSATESAPFPQSIRRLDEIQVHKFTGGTPTFWAKGYVNLVNLDLPTVISLSFSSLQPSFSCYEADSCESKCTNLPMSLDVPWQSDPRPCRASPHFQSSTPSAIPFRSRRTDVLK